MGNATIDKRIAQLIRADKTGRLLVKLHNALLSDHAYAEYRAEMCFSADEGMSDLDDALCDLEEVLDYDYSIIRGKLRKLIARFIEGVLANKTTTFTYLARIHPIFGRSMINKMYAEDPEDRKLKFLYIYPMMCAALVDCHPGCVSEESRRRAFAIYKDMVAISKKPSKYLKGLLLSEYPPTPVNEEVLIREITRTI